MLDPGRPLRDALLDLFRRAWAAGTLPSTWADSILVPLSKPGDIHDPGNSRPIALINTVAKLYSVILNARLQNAIASAPIGHRLLAPSQVRPLYGGTDRGPA